MEIRVEPAVLRWARERFGITPEQLASKLEKQVKHVTSDLVREWETGTRTITFAQLKKIAEVYKRPLAVFFLTSPPDEKANPPDRRTLGSVVNPRVASELALSIRRARRIQAL